MIPEKQLIDLLSTRGKTLLAIDISIREMLSPMGNASVNEPVDSLTVRARVISFSIMALHGILFKLI